jgi:hypothetical protein
MTKGRKALLATLLLCAPAIGAAWLIQARKKTQQARVGIQALEDACSLYDDQYDSLPLSAGTNSDTTVTTDDSETGIITASLYYPQRDNYRVSFLEFREAKNGKNGIIKTGQSYSMLDPWGNPYFIRLDLDYNQSITAPVTGEIHHKRFLIWSSGPDGKTGTPETTKDDIHSWKDSH